jgi:hypothetical protein
MPSRPGSAPSGVAAMPAREGRPRGSRVPWRLLAAVVLAGAISAVIVWLVMGAPSRSSVPAAAVPGAAPALPGDAGLRHAIRAGQGSDPLAGNAGAPFDASSAQRSSPPRVAPGAAAVMTPGPAREMASKAEPRAAPSGASPAATPGTRSAPPADASPRPHPPAEAGAAHHPAVEKSSPPATTPARPPARAPEALTQLPLPSPPAGESMQMWLTKLYHQADYATIVQVCSGTKVTVDIASVCVLAACQDHAAAKAKIWLSEVSKTSRDTAAARCKELGNVDLKGTSP